MGWWIALGILTLLAVLPLGVSVSYDSDGAVIKVIVGPLKITLFPRPKKDKKPKKEKKSQKQKPVERSSGESAPTQKKEAAEYSAATENEKSAKKPEQPVPALPEQSVSEEQNTQQSDASQEAPAQPEKKKNGGPITDFLPLVKTLFEMLSAFRRRLRVNMLELKLVMAGGDPADLGINYGRVWTAIGNFQPYLERFLVIKKRKIEVECDFCASQTLVTARLDLTITLGRIIGTVVVYSVKALIQFLKINKKRKGGAAK
jgi:DNA mismatch repair ATPase MutL